jgi:hypothetical protein
MTKIEKSPDLKSRANATFNFNPYILKICPLFVSG